MCMNASEITEIKLSSAERVTICLTHLGLKLFSWSRPVAIREIEGFGSWLSQWIYSTPGEDKLSNIVLKLDLHIVYMNGNVTEPVY